MPVEKKPGPTTAVSVTDAIAEQLAALRDVLRGFVGNCELIDGQAQRYVLQYLQPSERPSAEPIPPFKVAKEEAASLVKLGEGVERIVRQLLPLVRSAGPALEYGVKDAGPFATAVAEHLDAIWAAVAQYREQLNIVLESQVPSRITVRSWGQVFNNLAGLYDPIKGDLVPKLERYAARFGSVAVRPRSESAPPEQPYKPKEGAGCTDGGDGPVPPNLLRWNGQRHELQPKVWALIQFMWSRNQAPEDELQLKVWGATYSMTQGLVGGVKHSAIKATVSRANDALVKISCPIRFTLRAGNLYKKTP